MELVSAPPNDWVKDNFTVLVLSPQFCYELIKKFSSPVVVLSEALYCRDHGFVPRLVRGCSSLVFVV